MIKNTIKTVDKQVRPNTPDKMSSTMVMVI